MLTTLRTLFFRWFRSFGSVKADVTALPAPSREVEETNLTKSNPNPTTAPYDETLFERARTQWQYGEWEKLAKLSEQSIKSHPERAKLALVVASALQQLNNQISARHFLLLAREWGCEKKLIAQVLIAGVHNTLARVAAINGDRPRAEEHFRQAVKSGGGDERLISRMRALRELDRLPYNEIAVVMYPTRKDVEWSMNSMETLAPSALITSTNQGVVSYAQNFEDVMLWRALGHIENGFYIDVGAQDPIVDSVSKAFYERGWRGIHVEPSPHYAERLRQDRPDEIVVQAAVSEQPDEIIFYDIEETGLSTGDVLIASGHAKDGFNVREIKVQSVTLAQLFDRVGERDIHWLKIDVEGMEEQALAGWGKVLALPWIVVVESTLPNTQIETHQRWQHHLFQRGYREVYFDGLNRFYLSWDHQELASSFLYGPNLFDFKSLTIRRHN